MIQLIWLQSRFVKHSANNYFIISLVPTPFLQRSKMKVFAAVLCLAAVANAGLISAAVAPTVIARAPSLDSAVIKSDRIGGNFAYSVAESHAYTAHTPIIQQVATPVAVSYSAPHIQLAHAPAVAAVRTIAAPTLLAHHGIATIAGAPAATVRIA